MNILSKDPTLRGVKLKINFVNECLLKEFVDECNSSFTEALEYELSNIYDDSREKIISVLVKKRGGIEYKIVLNSNCITFYAKIEVCYNIENVLSQMEKAINLFYSFVYKMQGCRLKVTNITFSKCKDISESDIKYYFEHSNAIAEDNIGLFIKRVQNDRFNFLLKSYFINKTEEKNFFNNIENNIYRLYNISYKE